MALENSGVDWSIAGAFGDDAALLAELRAALFADANAAADLLRRSRCDGNWRVAAERLQSLAASFGATALLAAASEALKYAPNDPVAIRHVDDAVRQLRSS